MNTECAVHGNVINNFQKFDERNIRQVESVKGSANNSSPPPPLPPPFPLPLPHPELMGWVEGGGREGKVAPNEVKTGEQRERRKLETDQSNRLRVFCIQIVMQIIPYLT